jgi:hypothetical protein
MIEKENRETGKFVKPVPYLVPSLISYSRPFPEEYEIRDRGLYST